MTPEWLTSSHGLNSFCIMPCVGFEIQSLGLGTWVWISFSWFGILMCKNLKFTCDLHSTIVFLIFEFFSELNKCMKDFWAFLKNIFPGRRADFQPHIWSSEYIAALAWYGPNHSQRPPEIHWHVLSAVSCYDWLKNKLLRKSCFFQWRQSIKIQLLSSCFWKLTVSKRLSLWQQVTSSLVMAPIALRRDITRSLVA